MQSQLWIHCPSAHSGYISFQYFIFGIADLFTYVGLLEFFYSEAPKELKSISSCFLWSSMALGYFFSTILVKIVNHATKKITRSGGWMAGNNINKNHLNLFYWLLSLMSLINFFIYLFVAKRYKYRPQNPVEDDSNDEKIKAWAKENLVFQVVIVQIKNANYDFGFSNVRLVYFFFFF